MRVTAISSIPLANVAAINANNIVAGVTQEHVPVFVVVVVVVAAVIPAP